MPNRLVVAAASLLLCACPRTTPIGDQDGGGNAPRTRLAITGSFCTQPGEATGFPLKVLFVMDQSGSMCVTDPPGAQPAGNFCQSAGILPGGSEPARVRMVKAALAKLATVPSAQAGLIVYSQYTKKVFPPQVSTAAFGRADDPALLTELSLMPTQLGKGSDLQGALEMVRSLVEWDIVQTQLNAPAELPRTRYQIVLVTDGAPSPRCTLNDGAGAYASAMNPMGTWADSDATYCNTVDPQDPDYIPGFFPGGDRNQNQQLFAPIEALKGIAANARVGKIELNTMLVTNAETIAQCGAICADLYPPDTSTSDRVEAARFASTWLLGELSHRLNGTFRGFQNNAGLGELATAAVDSATLFSPTVVRSLFVQPASAVRTANGWEPDADGDGLSDAVESAAGSKTRPDSSDSDGDGFDDLYESTHASLGFDPAVADLRGCDPARPNTLGCRATDGDGDGLSQFSERWNFTREVLADSDSDGIPDGLELRFGLDPATPNYTDLDGDAQLDAAEVRQGTNPLAANGGADGEALQVSWTLTSQSAAGASCYDLTLDNLPLEAPAGQPALFKVWLGQAPAAAPGDYGVWMAACARALRTDTEQSPADLVLPGLDGHLFHPPQDLNVFRQVPNLCATPADFPSP